MLNNGRVYCIFTMGKSKTVGGPPARKQNKRRRKEREKLDWILWSLVSRSWISDKIFADLNICFSFLEIWKAGTLKISKNIKRNTYKVVLPWKNSNSFRTWTVARKKQFKSLPVTNLKLKNGVLSISCKYVSLQHKKLQSFTKYLRLTLVFMLNSALREKFNVCFSRVFCYC